MRSQFEQRFELELEKIAQSLQRKGGTKKADKVHQRIGRARERYPSVQHYYDITVTLTPDHQTATALNWSKNEQQYATKQATLGVYFLRTSLPLQDEVTIWNIYNTIREIESSFRTLKTDLDLRPIYHKSDQGTPAPRIAGLLAGQYHQVQTKSTWHQQPLAGNSKNQ